MLGKQLGGRYELLSRIGGGGMAVVYRGIDRLLNRSVAVKVLRSQFCHDEDFIDRFRREAQSAASLSHPNVVSIYDVGEEEDVHYIVMEYIEGPTLKDIIIDRAPLPIQEGVHFAIQIAEALEHAHQNNIIHRDIKPHNILIGKNGRVKVTDFGIARAVTSSTITHSGTVIGSVHYFSPEQAKGGVTGEQSDIYSLGVVLYEMLTGKLPFNGESPISVALMHVQNAYIEPREINKFIPQSVENIIIKAMAKDLHWRYKNATAMLYDLENCLLPGHENVEKKYIPSNGFTDEQTKVIPALTPNMWNETVEHSKLDRSTRSEKSGKKRANLWLKPLIWTLSILGVLAIGYMGFQYMLEKMYVPDVTVPNVLNLDVEEAKDLLTEHKLSVKVEERFNEEVEEGKVFKQTPDAETTLKENGEVTIQVSQGTEPVKVPDLSGLNKAQAIEALNASPFESWEPIEEFSKEVPAGKIIRQEPEAGTEVLPKDVKIVFYVSKGQESFPAPDLIGKSIEEAKAIAEKSKLKLAEPYHYENSFLEKGRVSQQFPYKPGEAVSAGQEIQIFVSNGEKPPNSQTIDYPISVFPNDGKETEITILVTDAVSEARGQKMTAVKEVITEYKEFIVTVVVTPNQNGVIEVYKDGAIAGTYPITYQSEGG